VALIGSKFGVDFGAKRGVIANRGVAFAAMSSVFLRG
jgi:hypothetical protein